MQIDLKIGSFADQRFEKMDKFNAKDSGCVLMVLLKKYGLVKHDKG